MALFVVFSCSEHNISTFKDLPDEFDLSVSDTAAFVNDTLFITSSFDLSIYEIPMVLFPGEISAPAVPINDTSYYVIVPETTTGMIDIKIENQPFDFSFIYLEINCQIFDKLLVDNFKIIGMDNGGIQYTFNLTNQSSSFTSYFRPRVNSNVSYEGIALQNYLSSNENLSPKTAAGGWSLYNVKPIIHPGETITIQGSTSNQNQYLLLELRGSTEESVCNKIEVFIAVP